MMVNKINEALETVNLPSLPELVNDLQILINRNEDLNVIADLLATDTSLVARVIELANTAYYGSKNITRIFDAVHLIGLNKIMLFVRTAYTVDMLSLINNISLDMREFWKRSYVSALISQNLASKINYPQPDSLYTAGLLMYIGELINALLPENFSDEPIPQNELAAIQLADWKFPPLLIEAVRYMMHPSESSDRYALAASILHITNSIMEDNSDQLDHDALMITHLSVGEINNIIDEVKESGLPSMAE